MAFRHLRIVLITAVWLASCTEAQRGHRNEGVLEFKVRCLDPENAFCALSPTSAKLSFKAHRFKMEMSAFGMFKTAVIGDNRLQAMWHSVDFMDLHKFCKLNAADLKKENQQYPLKFIETGKTKTILGFKAHQVIAERTDVKSSFEIWYTNDIPLPESNVLNPYAQIKGVLLEYRIRKMDTELAFVASSYEPLAISDSIFNLNKASEQVSYTDIQSIFENLK
mgnify:FL=1